MEHKERKKWCEEILKTNENINKESNKRINLKRFLVFWQILFGLLLIHHYLKVLATNKYLTCKDVNAKINQIVIRSDSAGFVLISRNCNQMFYHN
jgi:hypothetical protein